MKHARQPNGWPKALRAERQRQGLTQQDFGLLIGYAGHASTVARIEAGVSATSDRARARIESMLGKRLTTQEVDMNDTETEGDRVKEEIRARIDPAVAESPAHPDAKTIEDFGGDLDAFFRYVGGEVER